VKSAVQKAEKKAAKKVALSGIQMAVKKEPRTVEKLVEHWVAQMVC
jgi:hypothetical protein